MRVTEQSRLAAHVSYLQAASERLDRVQQQLATGRRINAASDDPAGASQALSHRKHIAYEAQMRRNMENGVAFMNATEAALGSANDALQRIRELTVQAANDTMSTQDRQAAAEEVDQLIGQLAQVANSNFAGAYLFAGFQSNSPAYNVAGSPPLAITYQGDAGQRLVRISQQDQVAINVLGSQAFGTMFDDLIILRNNLQSSVSGQTIGASLGSVDAALKRVLDARADVGARINRFEAAQHVSEATDTELQKLRSEIEETDLPSAIVAFTAQQDALQAALGAIGRTSNMTLLDYLR
ncbi:MAG: flagellar hook-associated protein FlgL [Dehalococcoidia bacterium]|nr:flagellar hook-associated protein FlgL [Dehalococcoidia bacterium]